MVVVGPELTLEERIRHLDSCSVWLMQTRIKGAYSHGTFPAFVKEIVEVEKGLERLRKDIKDLERFVKERCEVKVAPYPEMQVINT